MPEQNLEQGEQNEQEQEQINSEQQDSQERSEANTNQQQPNLSVYEDLLRDNNRRMREQETEIQRLREERESKLNQREPLTAADMLNDPEKFLSRISEEVQKQVKPLHEFRQQFESTNKLEQLKSKFRKDPKFRDVFDYAEAMLDEGMARTEPTEGNMRAMLLAIKGAIAVGDIQIPQSNNRSLEVANNEQNNSQTSRGESRSNMNIPAHLRPSAPNAPVNKSNQNGQTRKLNELEKRIARERGMTDGEYITWLEMDPREVPFSREGLKKEGAK